MHTTLGSFLGSQVMGQWNQPQCHRLRNRHKQPAPWSWAWVFDKGWNDVKVQAANSGAKIHSFERAWKEVITDSFMEICTIVLINRLGMSFDEMAGSYLKYVPMTSMCPTACSRARGLMAGLVVTGHLMGNCKCATSWFDCEVFNKCIGVFMKRPWQLWKSPPGFQPEALKLWRGYLKWLAQWLMIGRMFKLYCT